MGIIFIATKYRPALITSSGDVIKRTRKFDA
jgi:hypothetical protein